MAKIQCGRLHFKVKGYHWSLLGPFSLLIITNLKQKLYNLRGYIGVCFDFKEVFKELEFMLWFSYVIFNLGQKVW